MSVSISEFQCGKIVLMFLPPELWIELKTEDTMEIEVATNAHENNSQDDYVQKGFDKF